MKPIYLDPLEYKHLYIPLFGKTEMGAFFTVVDPFPYINLPDDSDKKYTNIKLNQMGLDVDKFDDIVDKNWVPVSLANYHYVKRYKEGDSYPFKDMFPSTHENVYFIVSFGEDQNYAERRAKDMFGGYVTNNDVFHEGYLEKNIPLSKKTKNTFKDFYGEII